MMLVTGATGHLGNVLVRELLADGYKVKVMMLPAESGESLRGLPVATVRGDVLQPASLEEAMQEVDTVFHLAGVISIMPGAEKQLFQVNVEGARNVAAAALKAGVRRLVHVSSIHAFRRRARGIIDESAPFDPHNPCGAYDRSKAAGTLAVLEAVKQGLNAVIVCPTGVIGPYDFRASEMGRVIAGFARRRIHFLINGAFDFVDVRDVARGLILAAEKGRRGEAYILSGTRVTVEELKQLTQKIAGVRSPGIMVPPHFALGCAYLAQLYYRLSKTTPKLTPYSLRTLRENSFISSAKARRELGYTSRPLEETLADYLSWLKTQPAGHFSRRYRRILPAPGRS